MSLCKKLILTSPLLLVSIILYSWIRPEMIISNAEEGLLFYNPNRTYNLFKEIWFDNGLGYAVPFLPSRLPFFYISSALFTTGLQPYLIQGFTFFVILLIPFIYLPKLLDIYLQKSGKLVGFTSAFFYLFNFFTMTQVFNRMLYPLMFFWSLLPLFLYLWIKWIKNKRIVYLLLFLLTSFLFSYIFALPSGAIGLWILLMIFSLYELLKSKKKEIVYLSILGLILWLSINTWWIGPLWLLRNDDFQHMTNTGQNLRSLIDVSAYYDNLDILLLKQKFYFDSPSFFKTFADSPRVSTVSIIILLLFASGTSLSLIRKKLIAFVATLLISLFLVKGVNPPFGMEFYELLFKNVPFTQALRNPYEKLGSLFLLPYSVLSAYGLYNILKIITTKYALYLTVIVGMSLSFIIGRPILNGDLFFGYYYVKVPTYYSVANDLINNKGDGRIIHLPHRGVSNVKYTWGYEGEDTAKYLFDNPSISGVMPLVDMKEYYSLLPGYFKENRFSNILNTMNVDFVVIHEDMVFDASYLGNATSSKEMVEHWDGSTFLGKIDSLEVYTIEQESSLDYFFTVGELKRVENIRSYFNYAVTDAFQPDKEAVFIEDVNTTLINFDSTSYAPEIVYQKMSNGEYIVNVLDAKEPYVLVFSSKYNHNWIARTNTREYLNSHFRVNGYANGWIVDKLGSYTIEIKFKVWPWE